MAFLRRSLAGLRPICGLPRSLSARTEPGQAKSFLDIGLRSVLNEDHDAMRVAARKFFETSVIPFHPKWEDDMQVPRSIWLEAGKQGFLGITTPEKYGGPGGDILMASVFWDEQGYSGCWGPGFSIHSEICLPYIHHYGSEAQKEKYLPKASSGECIVAIAMTEPGAGSDLQGIKTVAQDAGDHWIINGSKTFISNGQLCDTVIVVARTDLSKKAAHGISLIMVDANTPGFTKGRNLKKIGLRGQDTSELFFDNVRVPKGNILGEPNKGFYHLMTELPQERLTIAGLAVAASEAVFEETRRYVQERKAFGATLFELQTIRHKLAELKTSIVISRTFLDHCLALHMDKRLDQTMASMAKYYCTDLQNKVADECLQLHGGYGFMQEYSVARAFVDARVQKIYGGANEVMKELISRSVKI
eukprot:m.181176 g.181176  ORF g.181176 m.181176 type:complete len:417 (+) comp53463_c0_seq1:1483-2733(+)